ncbi:MAG: hypothetical protein ACK5OX_15825 [Desertimonas sp.]
MRALSTGRRPRRPVDRGLLAASLGIAVGVVAIVYAFVTANSGVDEDLPDGVESVSPLPAAPQVLAQTQVIADLAESYLGEFTIDGVALDTIRLDEVGTLDVEPGTQVDIPPGAIYEPGNATLTFTPSEHAPIDRFESGRHQVTLLFWPIEEGRGAARTYVWYFTSV